MTNEQKIRALLTPRSTEFVCAPLSFNATGPVPIQQLRSIYRLRAERNEQNGNSIQGFGELMAGLDSISTGEVVVYSWQTPQTTFAVFTNAELTKVIGVLRFPETARAQLAVTYKTKAAPPAGERNFTRSDTNEFK